MLTKSYEVEWVYLNEADGQYYTEYRNFKNTEDQQTFALEKLNESNTYEIRVITTDIWRNEL